MSTFEQSEFAERLKQQRIRAGYIRQRDLADAAGVSPQVISYYEKGERLPDACILARLAQKLNCSVDYLLQLEDAPNHDTADIREQTGLTIEAILSVQNLNALHLAGKIGLTKPYSDLSFVNDFLSSDLLMIINGFVYPSWIRAIKRHDEWSDMLLFAAAQGAEEPASENGEIKPKQEYSYNEEDFSLDDILDGRRNRLEKYFCEFLDKKEQQIRKAQPHPGLEAYNQRKSTEADNGEHK